MGGPRRVVLRPGGAPGAHPDSEEAYAGEVAQPMVATAELERAAQRVAGVRACRVERAAGSARPERVHVLADRERCSAVAKDIQSAWFAVWGLYVPRRVFAVSPVSARDDLGPRHFRAQLREIRAESGDGTLRVVVVLSSRGRRHTGEAAEQGGSGDASRLAALATLQAARGLLPGGVPADLADFRRIRVAGTRALVCAIEVARGRVLFGICEVGADERLAAARVVLDALNRALGG
jgi:hypothetical protein